MQIVFNVLILSVTELVYLLGILIGVGILLGWIKSVSDDWAYKALGKPGILLTACIGTPIHESGHAVMCLIFGHKINAIKFFIFNPRSSTLGYVNHSYNKHNLYQVIGNFFISLGPIFSGTAAILFSMYMLEPDIFHALQSYVITAPIEYNVNHFVEWSVNSIIIVYSGIFVNGNLDSIHFWLFLFLTTCISSHIALSREDVKGAISGLCVTLFIFVICNMILSLWAIGTLKYVLFVAKYNIYLLSVLSVSVAFSLITAFVMGLLCGIRSLISK